MSGNVNATPPTAQRRVVIIAANPTVSTHTGWPIGFWWAELTHPYHVFEQAGYAIEIRSPAGGRLEADGYSDPEHESGYSANDFVSLGFKKSPTHAALLTNTRSIADVDPANYDAVFLVGGQSPMYTFTEHEPLHRLVASFYEAGKIVAVVCHATCVLLRTRLHGGDLLVKGKTWTGFANTEEKLADASVGRRLQPFWIEDEARKIADTNFIVGPTFREFAFRDGQLITGQQQFSGAAAARLVVEALGR